MGLVSIAAPHVTAGTASPEAAAPPDDTVLITANGQQELALLCAHEQPGAVGDAPVAVTRSMRCSGPLLQAEAAAVSSTPVAMDAIIAKVRPVLQSV